MATREEGEMDAVERRRERALLRYGMALEQGDFDTIAAVLNEVEKDPALERGILAMHAVYEQEENAALRERDGAVVRGVLAQHIRGAVAAAEEPVPLTVGAVAMQLQTEAAERGLADAETLHLIRQLRDSDTELSDALSIPAIRRLFEELGITASNQFRRAFRDAAIFMAMGREQQSSERLAAARRQPAGRRRADRRGKAGE